MRSRDDAFELIRDIVPLCESVSERIERFGITKESMSSDDAHLDLLLMPIFQIGELIGSDDNREALAELKPSEIWVQAYGLRNRIAHAYGFLDPDVIWDTATKSIPELLSLCRAILEERESD